MLLQFMKERIAEPKKCVYVSMDHIYFAKKTHGSHDLSRRGVIFRMPGLSFREYLLLSDIANVEPFLLDDLLHEGHRVESIISAVPMIKRHFRTYLQEGYYPFVFEDSESYLQKLQRIIEKTIFEDVPNNFALKTSHLSYFKRILTFLATIPPEALNPNNIAKNIGMDNKTILHYLHILEQSGLVTLVQENRSGGAVLKQKQKIYLDNPNLYEAIASAVGYSAHYSRDGAFEVSKFIVC